MDLQLVNKFLNQRKKRLLILLALFGCSSYGVYKFYQSSYVRDKRKRIAKLLRAVISIIEMFSDSAETISVVSKDLNEFLQSDSNRIPASLKQLAKIASSDEFSVSVVNVSQALTVGVTRGYRSMSGDMKEKELEEQENSSFCDKIMDKLVSGVGTGFVSVVVGSFARNMVLALLNRNQDSVVLSSRSNSSLPYDWVDVLCDEKSKLLVADCMKTFVSTGVSVYLDKTMNINVYNDIFSGLTNPKHQSEVRDFLVTISNGAVETLVKTSHEVLTSSNTDPATSSSVSIPTFDYSGDVIAISDEPFKENENSRELNERNYGWVDSVSSTLAVPSNRSFVLDVTGRVTFETIRSILDFTLWKLSESLKRSRTVVHEGIVDRGREVISYAGVKSCIAIFVICLVLYLHVIGTRALPPV